LKLVLKIMHSASINYSVKILKSFIIFEDSYLIRVSELCCLGIAETCLHARDVKRNFPGNQEKWNSSLDKYVGRGSLLCKIHKCGLSIVSKIHHTCLLYLS